MNKSLFEKYHKEIYDFNLMSLQRITKVGLCISIILLFLSIPAIHVLKLYQAYITLTILFGVFFGISKSNYSKNEIFVQIFYYFVLIFLLLVAVYMGTYLGRDTNAFTFYLFLIVIPMVIIDRPFRLNIVLIVSAILFCFVAMHVKDVEVLTLDISNCIVSVCISMALINYNVKNRIQEIMTRAELTEKARIEHALYEAQSATNAKSEFLARMSHDIRTPMNVIIGITNLAEDEVDQPELMKEYLQKIHSSSRYLLGLVNDCLDMEKIESGNMELRPVDYSYSEFERTIHTMIDPLCEEKNITFHFEKPEKTTTILVDKVRFEQIFMNVLGNAVKFTPEGGRIDFIDRAAIQEGKILHNHYTIKDNGIGMSEEFQKKLFVPFSQEYNEMGPQLQGTGLGLSIVKQIVEMMDGNIVVQSKQGQGTTIDITLDFPVADHVPDLVTRKVRSRDIFLKKHVLLFEDHPLNTEIAKKLLEKKGMIVDCATNGKEGVHMFQKSREGFYDIILSDIRMPQMNGLEATKMIRQMNREDAKSVPIIAMSANAYDEDMMMSLEAGMNAHLAKPIEPAILYETLEQFL